MMKHYKEWLSTPFLFLFDYNITIYIINKKFRDMIDINYTTLFNKFMDSYPKEYKELKDTIPNYIENENLWGENYPFSLIIDTMIGHSQVPDNWRVIENEWVKFFTTYEQSKENRIFL